MALKNLPTYNLESFVDFFWNTNQGFQVVNDFDFRQQLCHYKDVLQALPFNINIRREREYYQRDVFIGSNHYQITWDIDLLGQIIKAEKLSPIPFRTVDLLKTVDKEGIEEIKLGKTTNQPVYVAIIPFLQGFNFVIDGNHRVVNNFRQGKRITEGFLLMPSIYIDAIPSKFIQTVVKIHCNIWLMHEYGIGNMSITEFQRTLFSI